MNTKGPTQFAIASVFKKETFAISEDEVVIKPTAEPEAEIDIPKGTFEHAAELQLNVCLLIQKICDFHIISVWLKLHVYQLYFNCLF